jgi:hypothetical protein
MAFEVARVHGLITQSNNVGEDDAATGHLRKTSMPSLLGRHSASEPTYNFPSEWSYDTYEGIGTAAAAAAAAGGQWSQAGSPIETSPCTTETESDEEDLAGLADRLARCTFLSPEDEELLASHLRALSTRGAFGHHHSTVGAGVNIMNGSPPSSMMVRSSWLTASSETSSRMSSPPSTPLSVVETTDAWEDLLYEAAAQHHHHQQHFHQQQASHLQAMQRVHAQMWAAAQHQNITNVANSHQQPSHQRAFPIHINNPRDRMFAPAMPSQTRNMSPSSASSPKLVVGAHHHPNSAQTYHRSSRCSNSKGLQQQQPAAGWVRQNSNGNGSGRSSCSQSRGNKPAGRMVDPNCTNRMSLQHNRQQQQHHQLYPAHVNGGSGMRAVFLGSNGTGRESSGGTGVFLPRTVGSNESKRKSACSTVLLPSRIVQVLNLNVEGMNSMSRPNPGSSSPPASMVKGNLRSPPPLASSPYPYGTPPATAEVKKVGQNDVQPSVQAHREVPRASEPCLPTEWTY